MNGACSTVWQVFNKSLLTKFKWALTSPKPPNFKPYRGASLIRKRPPPLDPTVDHAFSYARGTPVWQVFNKSLLTKFKWAIDEATEDFRF